MLVKHVTSKELVNDDTKKRFYTFIYIKIQY